MTRIGKVTCITHNKIYAYDLADDSRNLSFEHNKEVKIADLVVFSYYKGKHYLNPLNLEKINRFDGVTYYRINDGNGRKEYVNNPNRDVAKRYPMLFDFSNYESEIAEAKSQEELELKRIAFEKSRRMEGFFIQDNTNEEMLEFKAKYSERFIEGQTSVSYSFSGVDMSHSERSGGEVSYMLHVDLVVPNGLKVTENVTHKTVGEVSALLNSRANSFVYWIKEGGARYHEGLVIQDYKFFIVEPDNVEPINENLIGQSIGEDYIYGME
jgi:hypothetical protein